MDVNREAAVAWDQLERVLDTNYGLPKLVREGAHLSYKVELPGDHTLYAWVTENKPRLCARLMAGETYVATFRTDHIDYLTRIVNGLYR